MLPIIMAEQQIKFYFVQIMVVPNKIASLGIKTIF
jgi:hypothetical protein